MAHLHGAPLCWQLTLQEALVSWVMSPPGPDATLCAPLSLSLPAQAVVQRLSPAHPIPPGA